MTKYKFTCNSGEGFFDCKNRSIQLDGETLSLNVKSKIPNRRLYFIFSKACNLRCVYCFQRDNLKAPCKFNPNNIISTLLTSIHDFDELVLYGGEPLLDSNLDIIQRVLSCRTGLPIYIFTNGNISLEAQEMIVSNKSQIRTIIITLDGTKSIHDTLRVNPNGSSFDNAISTIDFLSQNSVFVQIQINVDSRNLKDVHRLIDYLDSRYASLSLHIVLNPIKYSPYTLRQEQLLQLYFSIKKRCPNIDIQANSRLLRNLLLLICGNALESERCGLSRTVVADFSGGILYACPHNEESVIGHISDKLVYEHSEIANLLDRTQYKSETCTTCEYSYLCSYGCPFEEYDFITCKQSMDHSLKVVFDNFDTLFSIEKRT